ncbi:hypothetical protein ASG04_08135 [Curtobacterium sp. Leaf183]|uniref:hypothetical protein n=1 Tax=Curtobacterium sp. Leaf183 TaxID=1736291 RepID=UPI0006F3215E|nr:hypothetical protein [Curtobacterium sp. Leaf183]KQS08882.1 hypothetical protein ASG04_08135 [Curtobacterium sp. Leaf183]
MWFERDGLGVHSVGLDAREQRRYFAPETVTALESLPPRELEALHDALAELEADVLVEYDPDDAAIDHAAEDRWRAATPPAEMAFPAVTDDFAPAFTEHVQQLDPRWRLDAAAVAFELVGTILDPWWAAQRARRAATWRTTARRRRGTRRARRR